MSEIRVIQFTELLGEYDIRWHSTHKHQVFGSRQNGTTCVLLRWKLKLNSIMSTYIHWKLNIKTQAVLLLLYLLYDQIWFMSYQLDEIKVICVLFSVRSETWELVHSSSGNSWSLSWHRWGPAPAHTGGSSPSDLCPAATGRSISEVHSQQAVTPSSMGRFPLWNNIKLDIFKFILKKPWTKGKKKEKENCKTYSAEKNIFSAILPSCTGVLDMYHC